jgi:hypothetical protein
MGFLEVLEWYLKWVAFWISVAEIEIVQELFMSLLYRIFRTFVQRFRL